MKFTAAGDALIQQRIPKDYEGFEKVKSFIGRGDARFFNLETTLNYEGECFASQFSGGTYLRANPECLGDLLDFGFNMTNINNNHTMDFSYDGMLKTLGHVMDYGVIQSGVGENLDEASAPAYLDTKEGRIALISVNTTFERSMRAGQQSRRYPGRPGINALGHTETIVVPKKDLERLKEISEVTGINEEENFDILHGYLPPIPENVCKMGPVRFIEGEKAGKFSVCDADDMARVEKAIFEAKLSANYIIVTFHTHEMSGDNLENVPDFIEEFSHKCIDAGAHAVIGHGPHLLRAIEVYKKRPIFYSLGDFLLQLYSVPSAPEDFYRKQALTSDATVHELIKKRSNDFRRGLMEDKVMSETIVPYWEMENGELKYLELLPVTCHKGENKATWGLPVADENPEFFDRLKGLCAGYGVELCLEDGIIKCKW